MLKVPEMWTRVKSRDDMSHSRVSVFDITADLEKDKVLKRIREGAARGSNEVVFDPESWKGREAALKMDQQRLADDDLYEFGKLATETRKVFTARAAAARVPEEGKEEAKEAAAGLEEAPALKRNHLPKPPPCIALDLLRGDGHDSGYHRRKAATMAALSAHQRLQIVTLALQKQQTYAEIGRSFNVSTRVVSDLVSNRGKARGRIEKRRAAEVKRSQVQVAIIAVVQDLFAAQASVWSAK